jgi:hypothetical protein
MAFFKALISQWVVLVPVWAIFATLMYGLVGSASAFAYQALVPPRPADATPQAG